MTPRDSHLVRRCVSPLCCVVVFAGCASPGLPRPPSLHLPEPVTGMTAQRRGPAVVLEFATPTRSTDGSSLTSPVRATLCRAIAAEPCHATSSYPGPLTISGPVEWTDVLPPELAHGAARKLTYKVQLANGNGRTAGWSDPVSAAAGDAPRTVENLRAEGSRGGIVLRWKPEGTASGEVLLERREVNAPPSAPRTASATAEKKTGARKLHASNPNAATALPDSRKEASTVWLHAAPAPLPQDSGGTLDTTAKADVPYRYTAVRSRSVTLDGAALELRSVDSPPVEFTLRDVYPPAVPQGLVAAEFPVEGAALLSVDLVWQPNLEPDLAGYFVYRQLLASDGRAIAPPVKLTDRPLPMPAFRDGAAAHGAHYRYTVTAVDARGNGSAASPPADVNTAP